MKDKILQRVQANRDKMVQLVSDMTKIPSVSFNEAELAKYLDDYCKKLGFATEIDRHGNLFVYIKGPRPGKRLIFNSHLDTVEGGEGWDGDGPFSGKIEDGKIFGRGSTDCKGAIGSQIIAALSVVEAGLDFAGEICLMYVVEEEVQNGERKGTYRALKDGFTGDMAVNGECVDLQVCLACGGMVEALITTHGVSAHGATPYKG